MDNSCVHLYCGSGKGKTTAAMGLALRALGQGFRVMVVQFLKNGDSGELEPLRQLGAEVLSGKVGGFVRTMTPEERVATRQIHDSYLTRAMEADCDLLILDEACGAVSAKMLDEELLKNLVEQKRGTCEIVLTGRNPAPWMVDLADYMTEMGCIRHPYDRGLTARKGVEY